MPHTLQVMLILLATAVLVVVACRTLRLPAVVGYLLVGVAVGPHGLAWVNDTEETRHLAEFGIVFLMFSIGLEFSLPQLRAMRRAVFGLGVAQVAITAALPALTLPLLGWPWQTGLALGSTLAMSSTAIVSRMLAERMELGTPHGRDIMGILLFQDLAVVAFLILLPALSVGTADPLPALLVATLKAAAVLGLILYAGQRPMRAWFNLIAGQRSSELFMLNVLLITLGLAALTELADSPSCWAHSSPACSSPKPNTVTRSRRTSNPSGTSCSGCSSSRWAWRSTFPSCWRRPAGCCS